MFAVSLTARLKAMDFAVVQRDRVLLRWKLARALSGEPQERQRESFPSIARRSLVPEKVVRFLERLENCLRFPRASNLPAACAESLVL
jgi:hypothetical protein